MFKYFSQLPSNEPLPTDSVIILDTVISDAKRQQMSISEELGMLLLKSQSQTTYDVARVVYELYKNQYKCYSIQHNKWVEYHPPSNGFSHLHEHLWQNLDENRNLFSKLSTEVIYKYITFSEYHTDLSTSMNHPKFNQLAIETAKNLLKVTYLLRDFKFKSDVIQECQYLFYNSL